MVELIKSEQGSRTGEETDEYENKVVTGVLHDGSEIIVGISREAFYSLLTKVEHSFSLDKFGIPFKITLVVRETHEQVIAQIRRSTNQPVADLRKKADFDLHLNVDRKKPQ